MARSGRKAKVSRTNALSHPIERQERTPRLSKKSRRREIPDDTDTVRDAHRDEDQPMHAGGEHYDYVPLPKNHIRVLHLEPALNLTSPLFCHFEVISLPSRSAGKDPGQRTTPTHQHTDQRTNENPSEQTHRPESCRREENTGELSERQRRRCDARTGYISLSYAWCSSHLTRTLTCDGKTVNVTESLHNALIRLREQLDHGGLRCHIPRYRPAVWADGLCIDQSNTEERNHQVQAMRQVYKHSSRLIVWLGDFQATPEDQAFRQCVFSPEDGAWVQRFFSLPWFYRRWVIQEYYVVEEGNRDFLLGDILKSTWIITWCLKVLDLTSWGTGPFRDDHPERARLICQLWIHQDADCQDPRDRIYALIGISGDTFRLRVDYTQSVDQMYTSVAVHYVRNFKNDPNGFLCLLACAAMLQRKQSYSDAVLGKRGQVESGRLPSWVPDWRDAEQKSAWYLESRRAATNGADNNMESLLDLVMKDCETHSPFERDEFNDGYDFDESVQYKDDDESVRHGDDDEQSHQGSHSPGAHQIRRIPLPKFRLGSDSTLLAQGWLITEEARACSSVSIMHTDYSGVAHGGESTRSVGEVAKDLVDEVAKKLAIQTLYLFIADLKCTEIVGQQGTRYPYPAFILGPGRHDRPGRIWTFALVDSLIVFENVPPCPPAWHGDSARQTFSQGLEKLLNAPPVEIAIV